MAKFTDTISDTLVRQGYSLLGKSDGDVFLLEPEVYRTALERKSIWICYLDAEITPEQIRRMFDFKGHVLIVVDEKLIPDNVASRQKTPMWLRVIHGLYLGRIYAWNGRSLFGLHINYDTGDVSESPAIQPTALLLVETGTWLRGWAGQYKLARFYDNAWWETHSQPPKTDEDDAWSKGKKQAWEEAYKKAYEQPKGKAEWSYQYHNEPPKDSGSRYSYGNSNEWANYKGGKSGFNWDQYSKQSGYDDPWAKKEPPKQEPKQETKQAPKLKTKLDYIADFKACGSKAAARALYKQLLKENHPDLNPGKADATRIMQEINPAWEYMADWWT